MDAAVKCAAGVGVGLVGHGGMAGAGRPARRQRQLVTLRCAGRDRRTVSGRELPRTRVASRDRIVQSRVLREVDAGRPAPAVVGSGGKCLLSEWLVGHRGPQEAAQLPGDGDVGDGRALAVACERAVAVVEADLRLPGTRRDGGGDVGRERPGAGGEPGRVLVVPGGLDEQPAGVAVAAPGDVAAVLLVARGVLAGGEAEVAHQLARVREAAEVADLGEQPERRERADAAEAAQPARRIAPRLAGRDLAELVLDRGQLRADRLEVRTHVTERAVGERVGQPLAAKPGLVLLGPGLLARAVDVAVAQQLLGDLVARRGARPAQIVACPDQIAQPLLLGRGRLHERQLAGPVQTYQLLGVATVGLDAVAGP